MPASCPLKPLIASELTRLLARFPMPRPELVWTRFRVTAGRADYARWRIELSEIVLRDEASARETLVHEFAHLLAVARRGRAGAGHGEPWRRAMRDLGAEPRVRHSFEVVRNVPRQRVLYACERCGETLARTRRLPRGRRYLHTGCGGVVTPVAGGACGDRRG